MVMNKIRRRVTEGKYSGLPKIMVCTDNVVIWELNESILEKTFQRVVSVCKDFGLNVNSDKCVVMKISQKARGMELIKCNDHEVKE
jgi:hypothetical protein